MEQNNTTLWIVGGVVVVLLILLGVLLFSDKASDEIVGSENEEEEEFESVSGDENNSVMVDARLPGNVVFYSDLLLEEDGFVVVRNEDADEPSDVIGDAYHEAGSGMSGNVELDVETQEGEMYYAELYTDTNGNALFDDEDEHLTTSESNPIRIRFEATEDLPEQKG